MSGELLAQIRSRRNSMSPALKRLADFVCSQPQDVLTATVTDLARLTETSEASVTRFCRDLTYKGYAEFKMALAIENTQQAELSLPPVELAPAQLTAQQACQTLNDTAALLKTEQLLAFAQALHGVRNLAIFGVGANHVLGEYLSYRLLRIGKSARFYQDMHLATVAADGMQVGDVVIVISSSGSTKDLLYAAGQARKHGATILALTNTPRSPLGKLADIQLVAGQPETPLTGGSFLTKVGTMMLIDLVLQSLEELDPVYQQRIAASAESVTPFLV